MAENRIAGIYGDGERPKLQRIPEEKMSILTPPGLVSILVPCAGGLEYARLCVPSVLRHSRAPFEIIFLDIGSLDGTAEYLDGVKAGAPIRVEIVRTETDLGIHDACKEALSMARGEYIVLLNNDTVVTHDWLGKMIALASHSPAHGAVGPMSNYAAPPQLVEKVPYRFGARKTPRPHTGAPSPLVVGEEVNRFAMGFWEQHKSQWLEAERLGGFCLLVKRLVLEKIGSLDRWTDLSLFDTDILSTKARQAGFMLVVCRDLFIHHFGSRTFAHGAPTARG
jgi:O-antigen biosynthesis protein